MPLKLLDENVKHIESTGMRSMLGDATYTGMYVLSHGDEISVNLYGRESHWDVQKSA